MSIKVAFVTDPIDQLIPKKDTTIAMMEETLRRNWQTYCLTPADMYLLDNQVHAQIQRVNHASAKGMEVSSSQIVPLSTLNAIFMRKDPPMDMKYFYATYLLELIRRDGTLVINHPRALREVNEKLYTAWFPQCAVETFVGTSKDQLHSFLSKHQDIIVKPLGAMGGKSIFRVRKNDPNVNVIFETLTENATLPAMAQRFIPEITEGDKRILLIAGEAVPYALARIPKAGETRGNLAAGATAQGRPLTDRDRWLCEQIGPTLLKEGLIFVGIDVIGDYITEINVTSPTGVRELDGIFSINICAQLMDWVEKNYNR